MIYKMNSRIVTNEGTKKALADEQNGIIQFRLTSKAIDRDGEVVLPMGGMLSNFEKNPRVLWSHDSYKPSIGNVLIDKKVLDDGYLDAPVKFDINNDPFAEMIFRKYVDGFLNAGSIGFIPYEYGDPIYKEQQGKTIRVWELLEFSMVNIPANHEALAKEFEVAKSGKFHKACQQYYDEIKRLYGEYKKSNDYEGAVKVYYSGLKCYQESDIEGVFKKEDVESYERCLAETSEIKKQAITFNQVIKAPKESEAGKKKDFRFFLDYPKGSTEHIRNILSQNFYSYMKEWQSESGVEYITGDVEAYSILNFPEGSMSDFELKEVYYLVGYDRPASVDFALALNYAYNEEVGDFAFVGEPEVYEMTVEFREKLLSETEIGKITRRLKPADQKVDFNPEKAAQRVESFISKNGEAWRSLFYTPKGNLIGDIIDEQPYMVYKAVANAMISIKTEDDKEEYEFLSGLYGVFGRKSPEFELLTKENAAQDEDVDAQGEDVDAQGEDVDAQDGGVDAQGEDVDAQDGEDDTQDGEDVGYLPADIQEVVEQTIIQAIKDGELSENEITDDFIKYLIENLLNYANTDHSHSSEVQG